MTTTVKVALVHHAGRNVDVVSAAPDGSDPQVITTLREQGDEWEGVVYDSRPITVREAAEE